MQLVSTQLFTALLLSGRPISSHLSLSQIFVDFHGSSQLFSALRSSCQLILFLLISSLLFSQLISALLWPKTRCTSHLAVLCIT